MKKGLLFAIASLLYMTGCGSGDAAGENELVGGWDGNCIKRDFSYKSIWLVSKLNILEQRKVYESDNCEEETLYAEELFTYSYEVGGAVEDSAGIPAKEIDLTVEDGSRFIVGVDEEPNPVINIGVTYYKMFKLEGSILHVSNPDMAGDNSGDSPETRQSSFDEGIIFTKV